MSIEHLEPRSEFGKLMKAKLCKTGTPADSPASENIPDEPKSAFGRGMQNIPPASYENPGNTDTQSALGKTMQDGLGKKRRSFEAPAANYSAPVETRSAFGKAMQDGLDQKSRTVNTPTTNYSSPVETRSAFGKAMQAGLMQKQPSSAKACSSLESRVSSQSLPQPVPFSPDSRAREKLKGLHEFLVQNKLFLTDSYDMKFNKDKTYKVEKNGSVKAVRAKESYCSNILFSILTHVGFNLRGTKHNNTMLAQGSPGLGKTVLAEYCGQIINGETPDQIADSTVQCNPQQTAETMIASYDLPSLMKGVKDVIKSSFVQNKTKILDEIQRLPAETISIILQAIDSGKTKYGGEVIYLSDGAIIATKNATDQGSNDLIPAAVDRFQIAVTYQDVNANFLPALIEQGLQSRKPMNLSKGMYVDANTILTARQDMRNIRFDKDAVRKLTFYLSEIGGCEKTSEDLERMTKSNAHNWKPSEGLCIGCHYDKKICGYFDNSVSMRGIEATLSFAAGLAWLRGKDEVEEEDVEAVLPYILNHRMEITPKALEKKAVWENDRIAFIRDTYKETSKQFIKYQNDIPEFNNMLDDLDNPHTLAYGNNGNVQDTIKRLEGYYDSVIQNMDNAAKFSYAKILLFAIDHLHKNGTNTN